MTGPAPQESPLAREFATDLRRALQGHARTGRCVTYRDLAAGLAIPSPHRIHFLTLALEQLIREDHAAGRPLLAALAVGKANRGLPGRGFFQLLAELGRYAGPDQGPEAAAQHRRELDLLQADETARAAEL